ncbi:cyclin-dependent kinase 12-like [Dendropsophus ebraccatus]|uniref:cyclin-dependent kinase 12-like n=1 Tax=Dendropsophus ebraccatus TaxID=150705 RepID=UPI003831433A
MLGWRLSLLLLAALTLHRCLADTSQTGDQSDDGAAIDDTSVNDVLDQKPSDPLKEDENSPTEIIENLDWEAYPEEIPGILEGDLLGLARRRRSPKNNPPRLPRPDRRPPPKIPPIQPRPPIIPPVWPRPPIRPPVWPRPPLFRPIRG